MNRLEEMQNGFHVNPSFNQANCELFPRNQCTLCRYSLKAALALHPSPTFEVDFLADDQSYLMTCISPDGNGIQPGIGGRLIVWLEMGAPLTVFRAVTERRLGHTAA